MATLAENVNQAISDFDSIKAAIENKGVIVGNVATSEYGNKISQISSKGNTDEFNFSVYGNPDIVFYNFYHYYGIDNNINSYYTQLPLDQTYYYTDFTIEWYGKPVSQIDTTAGRLFELHSEKMIIGTCKDKFEIGLLNTWYIENTTEGTWDVPWGETIFLAVVREGSTLKVYMNNELKVTLTVSASTMSFSQIGLLCGTSLPNRKINGDIYSMRIYNSALSEEELATHYNADKTK